MLQSNPMKTQRGYIALTITILIWGTTFMITKLILNEIGPLQLAFMRFVLAFTAMAVPAAKQGFRIKDVLRPRFVLFGLTGTTLYYALQNIGLTYTTVSASTLILAGIPAMTMVLAVIFLKERLTKIQVGGVLLVTLGVALVSMDSGSSAQAANPALGNLLIFISAFSWAVYTIQGRKMADDHPALVMSAASTGAGALLILPFTLWEALTQGLPHLSLPGWLGILYLGVAASALTTYLWNEALHYLPASIVSSFTNLVSVIGVASSYLLGENPPPIQIFGGALAILGVLFSSRQRKTEE